MSSTHAHAHKHIFGRACVMSVGICPCRFDRQADEHFVLCYIVSGSLNAVGLTNKLHWAVGMPICAACSKWNALIWSVTDGRIHETYIDFVLRVIVSGS